MLLGFRPQFAGYVEEGSKTHTIRAMRKNLPRAGEPCHCYTGLRTKRCALLGRWRCVKVENILVYECGDGTFSVWIGGEIDELGEMRHGHELSLSEKDAFAWQDGFRSNGKRSAFATMMRYWQVTHGERGKPLDFVGQIVHWDYRQPCAAPLRKKKAA